MPMARAASEPAVPGALGEYPQPNQVEMRLASLTRMGRGFHHGDTETQRKTKKG